MNRLLIVLVGLVVAACGSDEMRPEPVSSPGLTFIHLNDTYRIDAVEDGTKGGFARVATIVRELQRQGRDVRISHAGDFLFPSLESQLWSGEQMIEGLNFLADIAPLYLVPGNHEFDPRTPDHLIRSLRNSRFDWIGDNFRFDTGDPLADDALNSAFTTEYAGRTIGVFGLMLHPDDGGNARDYLTVDADYVGAAKRMIEAFEAAGVDMIIGITHLHLWTDREIAMLRAQHPLLTFIVGGHEHEPEYSVMRDDSAAVMKGASNSRAIWQIDVDFRDDAPPSIRTRVIPLDKRIEPDPDFMVLERKWRERLLEYYPFLEARVGTAALPLDGREMAIRNQETNWGNFVVDQMRVAFGRESSDLAFINSGTLRLDDFIQDDVQFEDIGRTFGFSSYLRYLEMTGSEFKQVLEAGYRGHGASQGYFPQVSGFRVCVDRRRPEFDRIVSLQVPGDDGWSEIDSNATYDVVVPDYLYRGGDGYRFPDHLVASKRGSELKYLVLDAVLRAQAEGEAIGEAVDPDNPRYVALGASRSDCWP